MIVNLYEKSFERNFTKVIEIWKNIHSILENVLNSTDEASKKDVLNKEDFLQNFHPKLHYSLEMIYRTLPKYYNTLQTDLFLNEEELNNPIIPIKTKYQVSFKKFIAPPTISAALSIQTLSKDIQKKVNPIKELKDVQRKRNNLILIATLINSPANLGGLTRTSEICGIERIVLDDIKITSNKEYKSLSLSAEKWVEIVEKKEKDLVKYLLELKVKGYTLIGLEQTANSQKLNEYVFPEKSVLLLG